MTLEISQAKAEDFPWLTTRSGAALTSGAMGIKATDLTGKIHGMVIYDGWTMSACQAHMATDSPLVWKYLLRPAFRVPFEMAGRQLVLGIIPSDNAKSLELTQHMGFRCTHRILDGWAPDVDMVVFEMRKEECRWLKEERRGQRSNATCRRLEGPSDGDNGRRVETDGQQPPEHVQSIRLADF